MMMNAINKVEYIAAARAALAAVGMERVENMNPVAEMVHSVAMDMDSFAEKLAGDARQLAKNCERFALTLEGGFLDTSPTGSSLIHDIATNTAKMNTQAAVLRKLLHALGAEAKTEFDKNIRAQVEQAAQ